VAGKKGARWTKYTGVRKGACVLCGTPIAKKLVARRHRSCAPCISTKRRDAHRLDPRPRLVSQAKRRAKKLVIPFGLMPNLLVIPTHCPVLGKPLEVGVGNASEYSPSLDRINPARGYVHDNVRVISYRANRIRSDASVGELEAVLAYAKSLPRK